MFTINVNANVRVHVSDDAPRADLARIESKLDQLILTGDQLMSANAQVTAFLDQLNTYTSALAAAQATQTAKIEEIAADIDKLIAGGDLSPEVTARLTAVSEGLAQTVAFEEAQAATLTAIAAKNDEPLPPPVEPPVEPVEG